MARLRRPPSPRPDEIGEAPLGEDMKLKIWILVAANLIILTMVPGSLSAQSSKGHAKRHRRYKLVDLTLGGPSGVSIPINRQGTVIGTSCLDPTCAVTHAFRWDHGVITDLGALPGENS